MYHVTLQQLKNGWIKILSGSISIDILKRPQSEIWVKLKYKSKPVCLFRYNMPIIKLYIGITHDLISSGVYFKVIDLKE